MDTDLFINILYWLRDRDFGGLQKEAQGPDFNDRRRSRRSYLAPPSEIPASRFIQPAAQSSYLAPPSEIPASRFIQPAAQSSYLAPPSEIPASRFTQPAAAAQPTKKPQTYLGATVFDKGQAPQGGMTVRAGQGWGQVASQMYGDKWKGMDAKQRAEAISRAREALKKQTGSTMLRPGMVFGGARDSSFLSAEGIMDRAQNPLLRGYDQGALRAGQQAYRQHQAQSTTPPAATQERTQPLGDLRRPAAFAPKTVPVPAGGYVQGVTPTAHQARTGTDLRSLSRTGVIARDPSTRQTPHALQAMGTGAQVAPVSPAPRPAPAVTQATVPGPFAAATHSGPVARPRAPTARLPQSPPSATPRLQTPTGPIATKSSALQEAMRANKEAFDARLRSFLAS